MVLLVEAIKAKKPLPVGFYDAGTQIVTADSVNMGNGLPSLTFEQLQKLAADPKATAEFYQALGEERDERRNPARNATDRSRVPVSRDLGPARQIA